MILVGTGLLLILAGGLCAVILRRRPRVADRAFAVLVTVGGALAAVPAIVTLAGGRSRMVRVPPIGPGGAWVFGLDRLSAWFLFTILAAGTAIAVYGTDYLAPDRHERPISTAHGLLAVLLVALCGVVTSQAVVPFLVSWEVMTVSAYFLVVFESERPDVRRAGLIYLVLTHASTIALLAMFAGWGRNAPQLTFGALANTPLGAPAGAILALALVAFGIKAGVVPLHFWLPGAHASAPSHVSALLSGVMLKMGIYGLLRVMSLLGVLPAWWGWTLLGLGLVSGVLGVLWALAQHDLKRLLAYHSVENIGIILLGMGVGALGMTYRQPVVAVLGLTGAVLHTLNHALFKSLLFLGAGAVARATGTRMIDELGGVGRWMPLTTLAFLLGSVAIVGLPPLNGFVSEWIVLQAILRSGAADTGIRIVVVAAAGLGLIGGLALACFTKVDGVVFLGRRRSPVSPAPAERGPVSLGPMLALAAGCLALGVYPALAVGPALNVGMAIADSAPIGDPGLVALGTSLPMIALLALAVIGLSALLWLARGYLLARSDVARSTTWACAGAPLTGRMQYTASSYAAPLLAPFRALAGVRARADSTAFHSQPIDLVLDGTVFPAWRWIERLAHEARLLQAGRLRWYLLYVILTLLGLLVYLGRTPGAR